MKTRTKLIALGFLVSSGIAVGCVEGAGVTGECVLTGEGGAGTDGGTVAPTCDDGVGVISGGGVVINGSGVAGTGTGTGTATGSGGAPPGFTSSSGTGFTTSSTGFGGASSASNGAVTAGPSASSSGGFVGSASSGL